MQKFTTCLMFVGDQHGKAEEAMNFYTSLFKNSKIIRITHFGPGGPGAEGTVMQAAFSLNGQEFLAMDSNMGHDFTFTPAVSQFVQCESEAEIDHVFAQLASGGDVKMPLDNYGMSQKFGWVSDKYGVSWQLNLP